MKKKLCVLCGKKEIINHKSKMSRGIRNNNPLNIRRNNIHWQGTRVEVKDKAFVEFVNMTYGYRAAWRILFTYFYKYFKMNKPYIVADIINKWAPPTENNTKAYIDTVLRLTGIGGNENLLPPRNPRGAWKLASILAAMTVVECGIKPEEVDTEAIRKGYELAFEVPFPKESDYTEENPETPLPWDEYWDWSPLAYGE